MSIFNFLHLIGGLSLFLFGMTLLGDSLRTVSGGRFEQLLRKFTATKLKGVALGAGVTAVVQSSSATTVMVVALVNAGVMLLNQAVSVIMGANIGTTITAWVLSLGGIDGDNFFVQMLKPSNFTPLLALAGLIMYMTAKTEARKAIATTFLGFSVLMFGMDTMTDSVSVLRDHPTFTSLFSLFSNPVLGVLLGILVTAIVQSSSASVGILQALSATGAINFAAAFPIIMGQNIGTCITALLSSIGGSRNAKRAAMIHLSFNFIGTVVFMIGFYTIHAIHPFSFLGNTVEPVSIAIVHTIFNLVTTAILLPFSQQLVKLSEVLVREKEDEKILVDEVSSNLRFLDERFIDRPGLALEQAHQVMQAMIRTVEQGMVLALELLFDYQDAVYHDVENLERMADCYEDALGEYLVKISAARLNEIDNRELTIMMHSLNDIERIGDHAINLANEANRKQGMGAFSSQAQHEIRLYGDAVLEILSHARESMQTLNADDAYVIEPLEDRINEINKRFMTRHIDRLRLGECTIDKGLIIANIYNNLERVGDHCSNIGIAIIQYSHDQYRAHDYAQSLNKNDPRYVALYEHYAATYSLD